MAPFWRSLLPAPGGGGSSGRRTSSGATLRVMGGNRSTYSTIGIEDVERAVQSYYERTIWVYRCVDAIATKLSGLPVVFAKGGRDMMAKRVKDADLGRLLNNNANNYETAQQFRYRMYTLGLLSPRGVFVEVVRSNGGGIAGFHLPSPARVEPVPDLSGNSLVSGYKIYNGENGVDTIPTQNMIWIKPRPHPTDPFRAMTPLQAARLSVDTDWLARMFNYNFLANDGRPGMLITIEDLNPEDADYLKAKFAGGGKNAGATTIIEGRGLDIADMSSSPRDAQYSEVVEAAKQETLLAFGTPESVLGNASGRTYDNADAEDVGWWRNTLMPYGDTFGNAFDSVTEGGSMDDVYVVHDYATIDALMEVLRKNEEADRLKFKDGAISLNEYRKRNNLPEIDAPEARVFWLSPGLTPIGNNADMKEIQDKAAAQAQQQAAAEGGQVDDQGAPIDQGAPQQQLEAAPVDQGQQQLVAAGRKLDQLIATAKSRLGEIDSQENGSRVPRTRSNPRNIPKRPKNHKALVIDADDCTIEHKEHPRHAERTTAEATIAGLVTSWDMRARTSARERLTGVTARKDTRHWRGGVETKKLDANYVVNVMTRAEELKDALLPVVRDLVEKEIAVLAEQYGFDPDGINRVEFVDSIGDSIAKSAIGVLGRRAARIAELDAEGKTIEDIVGEVESMQPMNPDSIAANVVTAAMEGAKNLVGETLGGYRKTWHAISEGKDPDTRESHRKLHGRTVYAKNAFTIGGTKIRYPNDPLAPIEETAGCRCWIELVPR